LVFKAKKQKLNKTKIQKNASILLDIATCPTDLGNDSQDLFGHVAMSSKN